jgi:hypothetical protein
LDAVKYRSDGGKRGSQTADHYTFCCGNGNANHHAGTGLVIRKGIVSAIKRVEFISKRLSSYTKISCRWRDIVALNAHTATQDKGDDMKDSFYEELERIQDQFPKILLRDFNAKVETKIFSNRKLGTRISMKSVTTTTTTTIIFQGLGLLACSGSEFIF